MLENVHKVSLALIDVYDGLHKPLVLFDPLVILKVLFLAFKFVLCLTR